MPNIRKPRAGSMQFWPRKRAKKPYPRVRAKGISSKKGLIGFAGYKVGMTHATIIDNRKTSTTKGEEINIPITIIECPPMKIFSARFYKKTPYGLTLSTEVLSSSFDKNLTKRKTTSPKKHSKKLTEIKPDEYNEITITVYTQPALTGIGKKKPELLELKLNGTMQDKYDYIKENIDKPIDVKSVLSEGQHLDAHSITKGKGFQGPVKRFGIGLKSHKSEKGRRNPGSLGGWIAQAHTMYRIAHAGQTGFQQRTEHNKWLVKIGQPTDSINVKGGYIKYGEVKNDYLLIKGSLSGNKKRLIVLTQETRENKKIPYEAPTIEYISLESKQGN